MLAPLVQKTKKKLDVLYVACVHNEHMKGDQSIDLLITMYMMANWGGQKQQ